jgi:hypothetical protein
VIIQSIIRAVFALVQCGVGEHSIRNQPTNFPELSPGCPSGGSYVP